jgi:formylglycine-generating enzyme required for sulfatase activity
MPRRSVLPGLIALLAALQVLPAAAAQQVPPGPGGKKPKADGAGPKPGVPPSSAKDPIPLQAGKSTWSRYGQQNVPADVKEPTAAELAAQFGLEALPPDASDPQQGSIVRYRQPKTGMLFVFVPGGSFKMGSNHGDIYASAQIMDSARRGRANEGYFNTEQPQVEIYVSSFFVGMFEVTNAEYRQFLEEWRAGKVPPECEWPLMSTADHTPYLWEAPDTPFWGDRQPVVGLTWLDCWAFGRWMGGRLPTEAEWEKAARGTDGRVWPWGNFFDPMRANAAESGNNRTLDVGMLPGGRSVWGAYDMAGNASEYVIDSYDENTYRFLPKVDPCLLEREPYSERRVTRGGRWNQFGLLHTTRTSARGMIKTKLKYPDPNNTVDPFPPTDYLCNGFRVVLSPKSDLFPDGAVERLKAKYAAAAEERRRKQAEKQDEGGR